jgi:hypothetical protein
MRREQSRNQHPGKLFSLGVARNLGEFAPQLVAIKPRTVVSVGQMSTRQLMAEGVRYVRERQNLMVLFGLTAITTIFVFPNVTVLMPFYANHVLHVGRQGSVSSWQFPGPAH